MSTVEKSQVNWDNLTDKPLESKYEKCRNITEEIYKRIDITFQIKKLEAGQSDVSDNSDHIDSNELSNETDLFACDKSDISSSSGAEKPPTDCVKFININNNEEKKKTIYKRPKKRFRKRVKKRPQRKQSDTEGSSDEAPLSRIIEVDTRPVKREADSPDTCMGVPNVIIYTTDLKPKSHEKPLKKEEKSSSKEAIDKKDNLQITIKKETLSMDSEKGGKDFKCCSLCNLPFRGEKGLKRHIKISKCHLSKEVCK